METENKGSMDGMEKVRRGRCCELVLRLIALTLTLVAAIVVGVNKETKVVPITIAPGLPPFNVPATAKWHYLSAFVYFVVSNAIACSYAAVSLVHSVLQKGGKTGNMGMIILILDLLMVALLFSSNGAAAAVGLIGYQGNSHVLWKKVCNVFGRFCNHVAVSIVISQLGSLAFLLLILFAAFNLYKKSK